MALEDMPPRLETLPDLMTAAKRLPVELERLLGLRFNNAVGVSDDAAKVLRGLAILGKPVPYGRIADLYGGGMINEDRLEHICTNPLVARCLTPAEGGAVSIFHATMTEYIVANMAPKTKQTLHRRAADLYAADLKANAHDLDALDRLPLHLWESGDDAAFLNASDNLVSEKHRLRLYRSGLRDLQNELE